MVSEIHFVTGKGGVGKSTLAAGLATQLALSGKKTLLVELGDQSYFQSFYRFRSVSYEPQEFQKNLSHALWNGSECLKEYARYLLKLETLFKLFYQNPVSQSLIQIAPALPELAILGKITSDPRHHGPPMQAEAIVVDSFATGHFLSLLQAPRGMSQAIKFGPMGEQSRSIDAVIQNQDLCHYHIVTLPEELPTQETIDLTNQLRTQFKIEPKIYMNKMIQTYFDAAKMTSLQTLIKKSGVQSGAQGHQFIDFLEVQMTRKEQSFLKIKQKLGIQALPLYFSQNLNPEKMILDIVNDLNVAAKNNRGSL